MAPHTERQDQKKEHTGTQESLGLINFGENDISTVTSTTIFTLQELTSMTVETSETVETTVMSPTAETTGSSTQNSCTATFQFLCCSSLFQAHRLTEKDTICSDHNGDNKFCIVFNKLDICPDGRVLDKTKLGEDDGTFAFCSLPSCADPSGSSWQHFDLLHLLELHRKKSRNHIIPHTERQDQKTEEKESHVPIKNSKKDNPTVKSTIASTSQVKKIALSTQDSCRPTVSVRRPVEKTAKVSTCSDVGKKIPSRTTLMMFVLTVTAIVNYVPHVVILSITDNGWGYCLQMKGWEMNSCMIALLSVNINSIVNPFIYSFCNPSFRVKCRQFFSSVRQRFKV
ncbi:uncharacterized protein LOC112558709 [Pomacea canaliculata]|uniref:uncharacterized protein LOC112558709 n=1 Tax=Pomacea canaliculata TaxID=400727 RepID=UPI000D725500|nr:uncharacterized protein LOC112558709 [Pomacea canaliculata]